MVESLQYWNTHLLGIPHPEFEVIKRQVAACTFRLAKIQCNKTHPSRHVNSLLYRLYRNNWPI